VCNSIICQCNDTEGHRKPMDKNFLATLLAKALGAADDATLGQFVREAMTAKARGANNLDAGEIILDLFLEGQMNKVPSKNQLEVTAPVAASGGGAENMVERFSDPATQLRHVANYDKIATMMGELKDAVKALAEGMAVILKKSDEEEEDSEQEEGGINIAVEEEQEESDEEEEEGKSLATAVLNNIMAKGEEEEEEEEESSEKAEEEEEEEEEGEEEAKALADTSKIKFAKAMVSGAKKALVSSKNAKVREAAGKSLRRARALATMAAKSKDKAVVKNATDVLGAIGETMYLHNISAKAKKARKDTLPDTGNQKKWPDKEGYEKALVRMETDLHGLMNTVANLSKMRQAAGAGPNNVVALNENPLQKAGANYFNDKTQLIMSKAEANQLSDLAQGEAEELLSLMQAAKAGRIDDSVVRNAIAVASAEVKAIFPEWQLRAVA